jgi:uncharacterized protein HemX
MRNAHLPSPAAVFAALLIFGATALAGGAAGRPAAPGQQNPPSLGEIARKLREQKKASPSTGKIWTNENLPTNPFGISIVGQPPPPPEETPGAAATKPAPGAGAGKSLAEVNAELAQAQQGLDLMEKELDLAKRDYSLQQQGFYLNPMALQDVQGQARLADAQQKIDAKQQEIDNTKAHILELQQKVEELKKVPPAPPPTPSTTPPQN